MNIPKANPRFPVDFNPLFTDKGYWVYAVVELPKGDRYSVYFAQIYSFDLPTMHDPCFAPPGLIVVPEVTIPNMERAVDDLFGSGKFFPCLTPLDPKRVSDCQTKDWPPVP
jgi:hypothetical protein